MKFCFQNLPKELIPAVADVLPLLSLEEASDGITVAVKDCETGFSVEKSSDGLIVSYARKADLFRALTFLWQVYETGETVSQVSAFSTLCYMADVSRNAVLNMDGARRMIRYLALMGYDSMMLYAEDTFEIPGYPYFGHMRGRYTCDELRELDDYADSYGVELIPCVQTLAHLKSALRWDCFRPYSDTEDILLVDDPRTYEFIDAMLEAVSSCFRSRRVHIGMDEAHNLGLGKYLDQHGYHNRFEILSGHLAKVKDLCVKYGLEPMIWSDMYFRLYNHGGYYMKEGMLPQEVIDGIPDGVGLVYWDYYTDSEELLDNMFENHKAFPGPVIFAGGAWKWYGFAPHNKVSYNRALKHAEACLRHGCSDVIVTGWGDNGGEASQFSTLPSLAAYAEKAFDPSVSDQTIALRFARIFGMAMDDFMALDLPNDVLGCPEGVTHNPVKYLFYNGVLSGLLDAHIPDSASEKCLFASRELLKRADHPEFGYIFASLGALCHVLEKKCDLSVGIRRAYEEGKKDVLRWYAEKEIPEILARIEDFMILFRQQWYTENKTFGFDVQEIRIGGLKENLRSAATRLKSYCNGEVDRIEELEQPVLPYFAEKDGSPKSSFALNSWMNNATASKLY